MDNVLEADTAVLDRDVENQICLKGETEIPCPNIGYLVIKRCFDFVASLCVSMVLLIPLTILALMVLVADPGNPFYVQERMGKDGKMLRMVKLRSMRKGADQLETILTPEQLAQYKKEYKLDDDPRLIGYTKGSNANKCFGAFLRRTSLDELPQIIWNICIKGNMSVVGPRPILKDELEENYTSEEQKLLLSVKPGLTGYWQAYARNNVGYEGHKRQDMELYYVRHMSTEMDIRILFRTVISVIKQDGAE